ncbi:acetyl-CoA carboxylase biotin carboxyl carrier protein [Flavobacteriales bacterium]|nr:acetyl-CoA carboxylase biotin carboxyl carrier protein [Flavobacteriales bacterium]
MTQEEIQDLIKFVAKSGVNEVEIERKDFKITIKSPGNGNKRGKGAVALEQPQALHMTMPAGMQMPVQMPAAMPAPAPVQAAAAAPAPEAKPETAADLGLIEVKSPMIGTFYRKPSPDKDNFVEVGSVVKQGDTVCVIEAMKLFNEIESEVSGRIVKILVDDNSPVEYDQPLFLVEPA